MTPSNTGVRRAVLSVLAVTSAGLLGACSSGQITQTSDKVAPVDGGYATVGDITVNDLRVVVDEEHLAGEDGPGQVGFTVAYSGGGLEEITLDRLEIDGQDADIITSEPFGRDCSLTGAVDEGTSDPVEPAPGDCILFAEVVLPDTSDLNVADAAPAVMEFSNGETLETLAGVVTALPAVDSYDRGEQSFPDHIGH